MADMIEKGQWIMLPADQARKLPNLRISPIGVVPQRDRRPRTIVDYSFSDVNLDTCPVAPQEAFGTALQRIVEDIVNADPQWGPEHMCKVDIADGFYRVGVRCEDIPKLGVILPPTPQDALPLVAFPLVLPMGWKNSPPYSTSARLPRRLRMSPTHASSGTNIPQNIHLTNWPTPYHQQVLPMTSTRTTHEQELP
jgi:hypothetical protein